MPIINCKVSLVLPWSKNCVITSQATRDTDPDANLAVVTINNPTDANFKTIDTKMYVPVITLSTQDDNRLLKQSKRTIFKRTIK